MQLIRTAALWLRQLHAACPSRRGFRRGPELPQRHGLKLHEHAVAGHGLPGVDGCAHRNCAERGEGAVVLAQRCGRSRCPSLSVLPTGDPARRLLLAAHGRRRRQAQHGHQQHDGPRDVQGGGNSLASRPRVSTVNAPPLQSYLASVCVVNASTWNRFQLYSIPNGGKGATPQCFTDYTAEFLLTRGPYALLGYTWFGCTNGQEVNPFPTDWAQGEWCEDGDPSLKLRRCSRDGVVLACHPPQTMACPSTPIAKRRRLAQACTHARGPTRRRCGTATLSTGRSSRISECGCSLWLAQRSPEPVHIEFRLISYFCVTCYRK